MIYADTILPCSRPIFPPASHGRLHRGARGLLQACACSCAFTFLLALPAAAQTVPDTGAVVNYLTSPGGGGSLPLPAVNHQLYKFGAARGGLGVSVLPPFPANWTAASRPSWAGGLEADNGGSTPAIYQSRSTGFMYLLLQKDNYNSEDLDNYYTSEVQLARLENDGALGVVLSEERTATALSFAQYDASDTSLFRNRPLALVVDDSGADDVLYGLDFGTGVAIQGQGPGRVWRVRNASGAAPGAARRETVAEFPQNTTGRVQKPVSMILGSDGALYGILQYVRGVPYAPGTPADPATPTGAIWRVDPASGEVRILRTLTLEDGEAMNAWLAEGPDGLLYGNLGLGTCSVYAQTLVYVSPVVFGPGVIESPLCASATVPYRPNRIAGGYPRFTTPYPHSDAPHPYGSLYRIGRNGAGFSILHRFSESDGANPAGPLAVAADGSIYGTTVGGGANKSDRSNYTADDVDSGGIPKDPLSATPDGTLYRIVPARIQPGVPGSGFEHLHDFSGGPLPVSDGKGPLGVRLGADGNLYGSTSRGGRKHDTSLERYVNAHDGTVFQVDLNPGAPRATLSLTADPAQITSGQSSELQWTAANASNCVASGGVEGDGWAGAKATTGRLTVSPPNGTHVYTLTCDNDLVEPVNGVRTTVGNTVRVYVNANATENDGNTVEYGNGGGGALAGGALAALAALGAAAGWRRRRASVAARRQA